ncbi:methyltransferase-like protein 27 [Cherax quadricarinatus]|uniref:methyltransferase-like protein 27 n=1 Tax=Cherax quadricarinatus TaxID=27406 RepID=UPI00387E3EDF
MDKRSEKDDVSVTWLTDRFNPGTRSTKLTDIYDEICSDYDKNSAVLGYRAPSIAAEEIANMVPEKERQQVRVLDVAAGTGWVGCQLHKKGFTNIDALEPSEGMMNILRNTGVYTLKYQEFIGLGQSTVPKDTYDVVVVCGSFAPGHIQVEGINDLINVAKPGGLVVILMRLEWFLSADEFKDKMADYMDRLEKTHVWRQEVKKTVPNYATGIEGILFIFQVL